MRFILKILLIFVLGAAGGVWAQIFLLPFLAERPAFQNFQFVKNLQEREMIINPKTKIVIQENVALTKAVEKVERVVVGVKAKTEKGKILEGSGFVATNDGLIVTLAELVPQGSAFYFYIDGKWPSYQILKRDLKNNLALVKIGEEGLSTVGFADSKKTKIGERIFLIGMDYPQATSSTNVLLAKPTKVVSEGIIRSFDENLIQTNIFETPNVSGSPLFDIEGSVVGLAQVANDSRVSAIPITIVRAFLGL